uniref:Probable membrane-associated kinase regulator 2 n=1 Tax=Tanacetum cinerariifolium TaxID=118510 RepID=A0A6L2NTE7_TANCI|nr:probable membrane-associated kinase regulator 2 [Tanacetum cinerariifolium]
MDVFSLLKFWKLTSGGIDPSVRHYESSVGDDEESFFDLVLEDDNCSNIDKNSSFSSSFRFSSPNEKVLSKNNKKKSLLKMPQSPLRTLILGLQNNKPKIEKAQPKSKVETVAETETETESEAVEVKIGALLKRDNSLRYKLNTDKLFENNDQNSSKRFSKDVVNKYLNKMKPARKSNEKSRFSEKSITPSSSPTSSVFSPRKEEKQGVNGGVFKVRKHLGKSRSASAILQTHVTKSDDSALEQQDSIKGAILHCKKSYHSPSLQDLKVLSRSGTAPLDHES